MSVCRRAQVALRCTTASFSHASSQLVAQAVLRKPLPKCSWCGRAASGVAFLGTAVARRTTSGTKSGRAGVCHAGSLQYFAPADGCKQHASRATSAGALRLRAESRSLTAASVATHYDRLLPRTFWTALRKLRLPARIRLRGISGCHGGAAHFLNCLLRSLLLRGRERNLQDLPAEPTW
jgi:hypothetical protein